MSSRLRLFITWLLLAALPWQGAVAASMVMCQPTTPAAFVAHDAQAAASVQAVHVGHTGHTASAAHAAHEGHAHDHGQSAVAFAAGHDDVLAAAVHDLQPDTSHHCAVCSVCGLVLALTATAVTFDSRPVPQGLATRVLVRLASHVAPLPDKPPRA